MDDNGFMLAPILRGDGSNGGEISEAFKDLGPRGVGNPPIVVSHVLSLPLPKMPYKGFQLVIIFFSIKGC